MTEEELAMCEECWVNHNTISRSYLIRKLKCTIDHADEIKKEYMKYIGVDDDEDV